MKLIRNTLAAFVGGLLAVGYRKLEVASGDLRRDCRIYQESKPYRNDPSQSEYIFTGLRARGNVELNNHLIKGKEYCFVVNEPLVRWGRATIDSVTDTNPARRNSE